MFFSAISSRLPIEVLRIKCQQLAATRKCTEVEGLCWRAWRWKKLQQTSLNSLSLFTEYIPLVCRVVLQMWSASTMNDCSSQDVLFLILKKASDAMVQWVMFIMFVATAGRPSPLFRSIQQIWHRMPTISGNLKICEATVTSLHSGISRPVVMWVWCSRTV